MNSYKTIKQPAREEYVINKSRFIGHACPCQTEEQALAFLKRIREEYRDATHNCYAYVIGENAGIMRYSDDGEPGGTAGLPMMEVLKARGVVKPVRSGYALFRRYSVGRRRAGARLFAQLRAGTGCGAGIHHGADAARAVRRALPAVG